MSKELFFTENFFKNLNEKTEKVLASKNKVVIRGEITITLKPALLFKSKKKSFTLYEYEAIEKNINLNAEKIKIGDSYYKIIKGYLGKQGLSLIELLIDEHEALLSVSTNIQKEMDKDLPNYSQLNNLLNQLLPGIAVGILGITIAPKKSTNSKIKPNFSQSF